MQDRKGEDSRMKETSQVHILLTRNELVKVKTKALRRGVWFRVLSRVERGLVDLAVRLVERVRSFVLARSLSLVVKKLLDAMESEVARHMRTVGRPLAQQLSLIAQNWGNKSAVEWAADLGFVKFLTICHMNTSDMFKG